MKSNPFISIAWITLLALATCPVSAEALAPQSQTIPWDQVGATAGKQYSGDGLGVIPSSNGTLVRCIFQKMEGKATRDGLWLTSTAEESNGESFRVRAMAVGRADALVRLSNEGQVQVRDGTVFYLRPGLTEEYSASMDGVRQDFLIAEPPPGTGPLRVMLEVNGASVARNADGVTLTLTDSGRAIAYNRLHVTDATGRKLPARMEADSVQLVVVVEDTGAAYPLRIDPTFSDANWVSMNPSIPGVSGDVYVILVKADGTFYVGGSFGVSGNVAARNVSKWDGDSWSSLGDGTNGSVWALSLDSSGNLYTGGNFTSAGGVSTRGIAKWDGITWSALGPGLDGAIQSIAFDSLGNLYAGGYFFTGGGVTYNNIAKWDGNGWLSLGSGLNDAVSSLVIDPVGDIYVGGVFTMAGEMPASRIAKWNGSSWSSLGAGMNGAVRKLIFDGDGILYAAGAFTTADGEIANRIAKWNGSAWSALGNGMNSSVFALAVDSSGNLLAGGDFTAAGGVVASRIAKWNGSEWSPFNSGVGNTVFALALDSGGSLFVGGIFTTAGGVVAQHVAKWNGTAWQTLGEGMSGGIDAIVADGRGNLYVGGSFANIGGKSANNIAKWDGSEWSALGSGILGSVNALEIDRDGRIYAGGYFNSAGNVAAKNVVGWNGNTWFALGSGVNSDVTALASDTNGNIYAGGWFSTAGGAVANRIAKWDGSSWLAMGSGIEYPGDAPFVSSIELNDSGILYVGGYFITAGGVSCKNIAKWNGSQWSALGAGTSSAVNAVTTVNDGTVYAAGIFSKAGGVTVNHVAKWNGSSWAALGSGVSGDAVSLAYDGSGTLYVGGWFTTAGGIAAQRLAKWNGSAWSAMGSGMDSRVSCLTLDGGNLYAGGWFTTAGDKISKAIAKAILMAAGVTIEQPPGNALTNGGSTTSFGSVPPGSSGIPIFYTIRNSGDAPLTVSEVATTGPAAGDFTVETSGMAMTLEAGATTTFSITFSPSATGTRTATLCVESSAIDHPVFEIILSGTCLVTRTLTYLAGPSGRILGTTPQSVADGANGAEVTALPDPGYAFVHWSDGVLTASRTDLNVTADLTVTAEFAVIPPALVILTQDPLPDGMAGALYSYALTAGNGNPPYGWDLSAGSLPAGLELETNGTISGTPVESGAFSFTVEVSDSASATAEADFSLFIAEPLVFGADNLPPGVVGREYSASLTAMGGVEPYTWSLVSGDLLAGLSLDPTGAICGTPETLGTSVFTLRVTDSTGSWVEGSARIMILSEIDLGELSVSQGTLTPEFNPATVTDYEVTVMASELDIWACPAAADAMLEARIDGGDYSVWSTMTHTLPLPVGTTTLDFRVTAPNGLSQRTYTLEINRTVSAKLASLTSGNTVLTPIFSPDTTSYTSTIPVNHTTFAAEPEDPTATLEWREQGASGWTTLEPAVPVWTGLLTGTNNFEIRVTAADASTRTYTLSFTRVAGMNVDGFDPGAGGTGRPVVRTVAIQTDGKILAGGSFISLGGAERERIGRLNPNGAADNSFNPSADGPVNAIGIQNGGKILVAGNFTSLNGESRTYLGRLNVDGSLDTGFAPVLNGEVLCLSLDSNGRILIGGSFTSVNGQARQRLARLTAEGGLDGDFSGVLDTNDLSRVEALAVQTDGKILIGGSFSSVNGQARNGLVRLHADGGTDSAFAPVWGTGYLTTLRAIAVQDGDKVVAAGSLDLPGGQDLDCLVRFANDGSVDTFLPVEGGLGEVNTLLTQADGKVLVGGHFANLCGQPRWSLGRLNANATIDTTFNPGSESMPDWGGLIACFGVQGDGRIIVGGTFTTLGGQSRENIGRLVADGQGNPMQINTPSQLPCGTVGSLYMQSLIAAGGLSPYDWEIQSGTLPSGLSLDEMMGTLSGTPEVAETAAFVIRATDVEGSFAEQEFSLSIAAEGGYESWRSTRFTAGELTDPLISGIDADPDHDGISNLLEYGLGLLPKTPEAEGLPTAEAASGHLEFTYRENKDATDLVFTVVASATMAGTSWSSVGLSETAREDKGAYWLVTVRDSDPVASSAHRFMRLEVATP